jgi:uncharacterized protein YcbK (DUF882 family)
MKLSEHLDLSEVTRSDMAKRKGISNMPTPEHLENFKKLAQNIFEPIRKHFGVPIHISSGYRSKALNTAIGGSLTSQHCSGEAIDIASLKDGMYCLRIRAANRYYMARFVKQVD